jgi:TRAP-type mannitol/chloroaromatic compound transport system permease small subunit
MRDYQCQLESGEVMNVAQLPTWVIDAILRLGFEFVEMGGITTKADVIDRLQLELFIREKGLRDG